MQRICAYFFIIFFCAIMPVYAYDIDILEKEEAILEKILQDRRYNEVNAMYFAALEKYMNAYKKNETEEKRTAKEIVKENFERKIKVETEIIRDALANKIQLVTYDFVTERHPGITDAFRTCNCNLYALREYIYASDKAISYQRACDELSDKKKRAISESIREGTELNWLPLFSLLIDSIKKEIAYIEGIVEIGYIPDDLSHVRYITYLETVNKTIIKDYVKVENIFLKELFSQDTFEKVIRYHK